MPAEKQVDEALVVKLHDVEGMTFRQIAMILGISKTTARVRYMKIMDPEAHKRHVECQRGISRKNRQKNPKEVELAVEVKKAIAQEYAGAAEYRKAFGLVFGTSKLQEYAA